MSNKVRSIARDIQRRENIAFVDEYFLVLMPEERSTEPRLCPECRAARRTTANVRDCSRAGDDDSD